MQLLHLYAHKLHNNINIDINFNKELNLLIGINGCGKTSALNIIDWLIKLDIAKLAITHYEEIAVSFILEKKKYTIAATKDYKNLCVTIKLIGPLKFSAPITIPIIHPIEEDSILYQDRYTNLGPDKNEMHLWAFLTNLPKPIAISLDRNLSIEDRDTIYAEPARKSKINQNKTPMSYVEQLTSASYSQYREKSNTHDEELKARIVMSALQDPTDFFYEKKSKSLTKREIDSIQLKIEKYLTESIKSEDVSTVVKNFFDAAKMLTTKYSNKEFMLGFISTQYRQIYKLADAFNTFEVKNAQAFKFLKEYLDSINHFLSDSNKELYFDNNTGRLVYSLKNNEDPSSTVLDKRPITNLSSGERQIVMLFTFLAFSSSKSSILIIDEPELSLHPKWQHDFMEQFLKLRPPNLQLIMATHSPDIVGSRRESCIFVRNSFNA